MEKEFKIGKVKVNWYGWRDSFSVTPWGWISSVRWFVIGPLIITFPHKKRG